MPRKKIPSNRLIALFPKFSPVRVKYKDIFNLKAFYKFLHEWLLEYDWKDETKEGQQDFDHWETYFKERIGRDGAKELWFRWRPVKNPQDAPFLKFHLDFDFHCLQIVPKEVIKEGKKFKVNKGEIDLYIRPYIEELYKEGFEKNKLLKPVKNIFAKRMYGNIIEQRKKELYQETYALQNSIKQWFKLKRYLPYEDYEGFFKSLAWPSHVKEEQ